MVRDRESSLLVVSVLFSEELGRDVTGGVGYFETWTRSTMIMQYFIFEFPQHFSAM